MLNYVALSKSLNEHGIWMSVAKCFQVFEVGNSSIVVKRLLLLQLSINGLLCPFTITVP
jgi:hypothetical protein